MCAQKALELGKKSNMEILEEKGSLIGSDGMEPLREASDKGSE
jgi:hypothetical protein